MMRFATRSLFRLSLRLLTFGFPLFIRMVFSIPRVFVMALDTLLLPDIPLWGRISFDVFKLSFVPLTSVREGKVRLG